MRLNIRTFVAGAALALAAPAASAFAPAQPGAAEADQQIISIPFDPPAGTVRYRLAKTEPRGGQSQRSELEFTVSFARRGDEVLMTVNYQLPRALRERQSDPLVLAALRPLVLRLDAHGALIGVEDEAAYWVGVKTSMAAALPAGDADGRRIGDELIQRMRALPDEERLALIASNVAPVIGLAGTEFEPGTIALPAQTSQTPFGPIEMQPTLTIERTGPATARATLEASVSPEDLRTAIGTIVDVARSAGVAPARPLTVPEEFSMTVRETTEVSLETGLLTRHESVRTVRAAENGVVEASEGRILIERMP